MSDLPALLPSMDSSVALSAEFLNSLKTPEDYENAFTTVSQQKNTCIWWEADIILSYYQKFLGQHLDVYRAGQLMNDSTVKYYLRTASGFPAELRIPSISFNHHYQATFADEWDSRTLAFQGDKRFMYAEKAADDQLSTRRLKEVMEIDQEKLEKQKKEFECNFVGCEAQGETWPYIFYKQGPKTGDTLPQRLWLHDACYRIILAQVYGD